MIERFCEKLNKTHRAKIVCLGDSVTHGYFESHENMHGTTDYTAVYHKKLADIIKYFFPEYDIEIINSGVGGECAAGGYERINDDVLKHNPDLVTVCYGLNDVNGSIHKYISGLDKIFTALDNCSIPYVCMTPNMLNTAVTLPILRSYAEKTAKLQNGKVMDRYISAALDCARKHNAAVCDCYNEWKRLHKAGIDTNKLLANGINHPKREMHRLFAYKLFETIFLGSVDRKNTVMPSDAPHCFRTKKHP